MAKKTELFYYKQYTKTNLPSDSMAVFGKSQIKNNYQMMKK